MSSPNKSASPSRDGAINGAGQDDKPRLTEEEKKQNHIASGMVISQQLHGACCMGSKSITTYPVRVQSRNDARPLEKASIDLQSLFPVLKAKDGQRG
jgi:hypothetical protein